MSPRTMRFTRRVPPFFSNRSFATAVLTWGGLWGLAEAGLGYGLHTLPVPGLAGAVLFPMGLLCMRRAFMSTARVNAVWGAALIAAGIKLLDLWLPGAVPAAVLRPAVAILLEAAVASAGFALMKKPAGFWGKSNLARRAFS
jgi:hypothetical protein